MCLHFKTFFMNMSTLLYDEWITEPEGEELKKVMEGYISPTWFTWCHRKYMDVTHVWLERCPKDLIWSCAGKEEHPTIAYQAVVDHNHKIHHIISLPFFGGTNDKTVTKNDSFPIRVAYGKYRNVEYVLYDEHGVPQVCKGVYFLVNGGYDKEAHLMCPKAWPLFLKDVKWSE